MNFNFPQWLTSNFLPKCLLVLAICSVHTSVCCVRNGAVIGRHSVEGSGLQLPVQGRCSLNPEQCATSLHALSRKRRLFKNYSHHFKTRPLGVRNLRCWTNRISHGRMGCCFVVLYKQRSRDGLSSVQDSYQLCEAFIASHLILNRNKQIT
jgi:hypothetical protein